jgi:superfamily II DNA or RNA helicase
MKTLYKIQESHAKILEESLRKNRAALDASETGCGKTIVAVELAARFGMETLVVCPKATIPAWTAALQDRGVRARVINYEKLKSKNTGYGKFNARKQWEWSTFKSENSFIIWDEVQKCMSMTSQNSKMLVGSKKFYNLLLSATAAEDPTEMKALGYILGLHSLKDYWNWLRRTGCKPNPWGALEFKGGPKELEKIHSQLFGQSKGSRLKVENMKEHFGESQVITEPLDFGDEGEIQKLYATMDEEISELKTQMQDDKSGAEGLVKQLRARQAVELLKVPYILEATEQALKEKRSVAIFVNFNATVDALAERLGTKCFIRGGQSADARTASMSEFQSGQSRLIICNIAAGGTGVSLHDEIGTFPRTALISPSFNAKELIQVMGRVHRAGGKSTSQQRVLFAAGTIEEKVKKSIDTKLKNLEVFNEGSLTESVKPVSSITTDMQETSPKEDPNHKDRAHARYSPSSLIYRELCSGWENDNDPNRDTTAADEGTRCHEAMEKESTDGLTEEQALMVEMCLGYIEDLKTPTTKVYKEERLRILDQFGTADWILIDGRSAHLVDTKFGRKSVPDAEFNAQLQAYAIGLWDRWVHVDELTIHILLPRRDEVSVHTFTRGKHYADIKLRIETIIARAKKADPAAFNPSVKACQYCGKKGSCAKLAESMLTKAESINSGASKIDLDNPDQVAEILQLIPIFEGWASKFKEEVLRKAIYEGFTIPGFALLERATSRSINSAFGAWEVLKDKMPVEKFLESVSRVSITDLEKNFASCAEKGKKAQSKQELDDLLRDAGLLKEESTIKYLKQVENK